MIKKSKVKFMMMSMVMVMMISMLSACNSGSNSGEATTPKEVPSTSKEPVELVIYTSSRDSADVFNERYGDALRKKFPSYTIKYLQRVVPGGDLQDLLVANVQIDIIYDSQGSYGGSLIGNELGFDMTELAKKHNVDLSRFEPATINGIRQMGDGKLVGLPIENSALVVYYNKDIFDKFGVAYPKDGMNWDEFNDLARKLNVEWQGNAYAGFALFSNYVSLQNQYSLAVISKDNKPTYNSDERWKKIIQTIVAGSSQNAIYKNVMQTNNGKIPETAQFTIQQNLAMYAYLANLPLAQKAAMSRMNWDMVSLPTFKDLPGVGSPPYPLYFGITKMSKAPDAAMEVLKYLSSDEFQLEYSKKGSMTPLVNKDIQAAQGKESSFKDKNYKALYYNKFAPLPVKQPIESKVNTTYPLVNRLNKIAAGEMDINTALRETDEEILQAINSAK